MKNLLPSSCKILLTKNVKDLFSFGAFFFFLVFGIAQGVEILISNVYVQQKNLSEITYLYFLNYF